MYDEKMLQRYIRYVIERHRVWIGRQQNTNPPWTSDPIIQKLKFTNNFRVLDPGSQFVLTDLYTEDQKDFITRCVLYRYTNLPRTWRMIRASIGRYPLAEDMNDSLIKVMTDYRDAGNTVFSGAYTIIPRPGVTGSDKVADAVNLARYFADERADEFLMAETQRERFNVLLSTPNIGKFMAMQILTDWGYGQPVNRENEFIVAGPGAVRGAKHLNPEVTPTGVMHLLTEKWQDHPVVRVRRSSLSLMDVQNTLCEFGKYVRELDNPRRVNPYQPAHPGPQPKPVLPEWM